MAEIFAPTIEEQIACVEREIAMRVRVYPRWVADKRLTQAKADREIESMRAVLATLQSVKNPTHRQTTKGDSER